MSSPTTTVLPTPVVIPPTPSPNPWAGSAGPITPSEVPITPLTTQELELAPPNAFNDTILPSTPSKHAVDTSLLSEFDPLADKVESNAREAWASAEGHPAPPPPEPAQQQPPPRSSPGALGKLSLNKRFRRPSNDMDAPTSAAATVTTFATLASLARSPFNRGRALSNASPQTPTKALINVSEPGTPSKGTVPLPPPKDRPTAVMAKEERPSSASAADASAAQGEPVFDFQKFLDQMKTKSAEPVAKYLRSFLNNFAKRNFTVNDQVQLIRDFLDFITLKMRECSVWRNASDADFDNATEAMEKLVMNRLYDYTFTPQIDQATHVITTDDLEKDQILRQRMRLFGWVKEEHLDVPVGEGSQGFMTFAQQELLKMNHYKAPRDKLICILNCCKVIFGLIRHLSREEGADSFLPLLIFVVLKANPDHLMSNIEYINRFRSPSKLQSEAGYYLSSLTGAVSFIETMDHTSLSNITQKEFESNVEKAIQALPSSPSAIDPNEDTNRFPTPTPPHTPSAQQLDAPPSQRPRRPSSPLSPHVGEEPAVPLKLPSTATIAEDTKRFLQRTGDSFSKPLNAIGKIFNEAMDGLDERERMREQTRLDRERAGLTYDGDAGSTISTAGGAVGPAGEVANLLAGVAPEWLFGGSGNATPARSSTPQTPAAGGGAPVPIAQTPYRPRVRPGSAGAGRALTPDPTPTHGPSLANNRASSYGFPSPGSASLPSTPNRPVPINFQQQQQQPYRALPINPSPSQLQQPPPQQQQRLHLGVSEPNSRADSPLDLTALQNEIDRAHSAANDAARGTLLQMFPGCDTEVIDMVLEANRGDLGLSIDQLLEMTVVA